MERTTLVCGAWVLASALNAQAACEAGEHHQLDFWLGTWDVTSGGETVAESTIARSAEGCAIVERYRQRDGYSGTSLNFHDPALHRWRQSWVDTTGAVGEFTGEPSTDTMAFTGETHRPDGTRVMRKMTLSKLPDATVRQHSLASTDGGKTWKPHYDFVYRRAQDK
jgi:hypothetical protein